MSEQMNPLEKDLIPVEGTEIKESKTSVKRIDHTNRKTVSDITKKPKNNDDVNKMNKRFLYVKTGNWVVYGRMLQLKRKPNLVLDGDRIVERPVEKPVAKSKKKK